MDSTPLALPGILLVGHGTRDEKGLAEFAATARQVAERLHPIAVEPGFLELATPTIATAWERLIDRGAREIVVAPILLFAAGHAKQDIPDAVRAVAVRFPGVTWCQSEPLGCHDTLLDLSAQRFRDALAGANVPASHCRLIVVGRGSRDREAIEETTRYARRLGERVGAADVQVGFLAMAEPRLPAVLADAGASDCETVVVQPHLLFHGELLAEVQQLVRDWTARKPVKKWLVAGHLGPAPQVIEAVIARVHEAQARFGEFETQGHGER